MFLDSIQMMVVMCAIYVGARLFDIISSKDFDHYGLSEKMEFSQDEWGNFNAVKNAIGSLIFMGISIILFVAWTGKAWVMLIPLIGLSIFVGIRNIKSKQENRRRQIEILSALSDIELGDHRMLQAKFNALNLGWLRSRMVKGEERHFFQLFKFLYVTGTVDSAAWNIAVKIHEHSKLPRAQWFYGK